MEAFLLQSERYTLPEGNECLDAAAPVLDLCPLLLAQLREGGASGVDVVRGHALEDAIEVFAGHDRHLGGAEALAENLCLVQCLLLPTAVGFRLRVGGHEVLDHAQDAAAGSIAVGTSSAARVGPAACHRSWADS